MGTFLAYLIAHPELVAIVVAGLESAIMPFVPVKWNGLAVFVFSKLKKTPPK